MSIYSTVLYIVPFFNIVLYETLIFIDKSRNSSYFCNLFIHYHLKICIFRVLKGSYLFL
jgi:hypothetical protein